MGKIGAATFLLSSLSLLNQAGLLEGKGNIILIVVTLIWSILQLSFDIYVFVVNPYSLKQKVVDLTLSTFLGSLYEEKRTKWSFKWLHCFCNPFTADFYVYNKWHYLMLMEKGKSSDPRKWRYSTLIYRHAPDRSLNAEEVDTFVFVHDDIDNWQHAIGRINHIWEFNHYGTEHAGTIVSLKRYYTVKDKLVKVVVQTNWIDIFFYNVKISELHSTEFLIEYDGSCRDVQCVVNLYVAWEWFSREPGCGVIDCRKGGIHKGSKFIHTVDLTYMHDSLANGMNDLYVCQHEDHGFNVAGP